MIMRWSKCINRLNKMDVTNFFLISFFILLVQGALAELVNVPTEYKGSLYILCECDEVLLS